eukprot:2090398-Rhodomonas_salina.2
MQLVHLEGMKNCLLLSTCCAAIAEELLFSASLAGSIDFAAGRWETNNNAPNDAVDKIKARRAFRRFADFFLPFRFEGLHG